MQQPAEEIDTEQLVVQTREIVKHYMQWPNVTTAAALKERLGITNTNYHAIFGTFKCMGLMSRIGSGRDNISIEPISSFNWDQFLIESDQLLDYFNQ